MISDVVTQQLNEKLQAFQRKLQNMSISRDVGDINTMFKVILWHVY